VAGELTTHDHACVGPGGDVSAERRQRLREIDGVLRRGPMQRLDLVALGVQTDEPGGGTEATVDGVELLLGELPCSVSASRS
jgi:hypothetical protein